jgi:hypothetical protein
LCIFGLTIVSTCCFCKASTRERNWGLDKQKVWSVIRRAVTLDVTPYFYFDSDAIAVRTTCRVGFGFVHPQAIVQITASGS